MNKRVFALAIALLLGCLAAPALAGGAPAWEALLPEGYEGSGRNYPVIYVLPEEADALADEGFAEALAAATGMDMIVVRTALPAGADVSAALRAVAAEVDGQLRTVPEARQRAAAGTGAGGYLAYIAALAEDSPFGAAVSVRGNFAGAENPWLAANGPVLTKMQERARADRHVFEKLYTYLDAPVDDPWTDQEGSTDDLGALMIGWGVGSASHEFTARPGAFDDAFLAESAARVKGRLTGWFLSGAVSGALRLEREGDALRAQYEIALGDALSVYGEAGAAARVVLADAETGAVLAEGEAEELAGTLELPLPEDVATVEARLEAALLGTDMSLDTAALALPREARLEDGVLAVDLSGDWHFHYAGLAERWDAAALAPEDWAEWPLVQPGLGNWTKGYGNISDENVTSGYGPDYFDFFITGNGFYARSFALPEEPGAEELVLSIGYVDDRCEVFLNGTRVGATGVDAAGNSTGETTWAAYSAFPVDPALLVPGGENTLVVRAWNDLPFGAGGWYAGPIGLYSQEAFAALAEGGSGRFFEESFESRYAASAADHAGTAEVEYLVYLPEGYEETERSYPTVYLLHQFNSDHTSYRTDHVDALLDAGIAAGLFDEMIVVVPNSSEESWWCGDWEKMVVEELVPHIDESYRTIRDARCRLTAGCSMGGQGAMGVALRNPDLFSGAISFFGAFSYGGANDPRAIARAESADYLRSFALYFICGNQDSYGFGAPAIDLHQILLEKGAPHRFFIENGGHDSAFYVPFFQDAFAYVRAHMYRSDASLGALLHGELTLDGSTLRAELSADAGIEAYLYAPPASAYTKGETPRLSASLLVRVEQDDKVVSAAARDIVLTADNQNATVDFEDAFDPARPAAITLQATVLDRLFPLATLDYVP